MERVPRDGIYVALTCWVIFIAGLTFATSAVLSMRVFAVSLAVFGLARAVLPSGDVPVIRSKPFDVTACLGLAILLGYLSHWAAIPLPG